jgi:hypothetical protein
MSATAVAMPCTATGAASVGCVGGPVRGHGQGRGDHDSSGVNAGENPLATLARNKSNSVTSRARFGPKGSRMLKYGSQQEKIAMTSNTTPDTNLEPELEAPPIAVNDADPAPLSDAEKVKVKGARARKAKAEPKPEPASPDAPSIQPKGDFPNLEDAFADMSKPASTPPILHGIIGHSPIPPRSAFRVVPRDGSGLFLWMCSLPYGEALKGESFGYPVHGSLRDKLAEECPNLILKRFEIRLVIDAGSKPSFLEVPADPAGNTQGEDNRQSLLRMLAYAETNWTIAVRAYGGKWTWSDAATKLPLILPAQSFRELADLTYTGAMLVNMNHFVLQRFRRAPTP